MRIALAALVAAAVAATASAAPTVDTLLKVGDAVDVLHTGVACFAIHSNGKDGMVCVLWQGSKPKAGTYGVGLAADGTAVLNRIKADGSSQRIFKRRLQAATKVVRANVGDGFGLALPNGVDLGCRVIDITDTTTPVRYRGIKVSCWRSKGQSPVPTSYGVTISDKIAGVFRFDAQGKAMASGQLERRQP